MFSLSLLLNDQYKVMCCIKTAQIVHSNLYFSSVFTFSVNYVEYCNMYRNISWSNPVSWCVSYPEVLANTQPYVLPLLINPKRPWSALILPPHISWTSLLSPRRYQLMRAGYIPTQRVVVQTHFCRLLLPTRLIWWDIMIEQKSGKRSQLSVQQWSYKLKHHLSCRNTASVCSTYQNKTFLTAAVHSLCYKTFCEKCVNYSLFQGLRKESNFTVHHRFLFPDVSYYL